MGRARAREKLEAREMTWRLGSRSTRSPQDREPVVRNSLYWRGRELNCGAGRERGLRATL